jgi:hypothetical protein
MRLITLDRSTVLYGFEPAEEGNSRSTAGEGKFDRFIELFLRLQARQIQAGLSAEESPSRFTTNQSEWFWSRDGSPRFSMIIQAWVSKPAGLACASNSGVWRLNRTA